ncbi:hypothetical protein [uncultured Draconibacterium sp.]|uniref:hypothetical protein n=1 Tax=uncultured Draconibacterium sp. TaxID=1573823 RepID=UPI002AA8E21C|nr:hypothetical protein [uncultured Draconibacterium sp.]
MPDKFRNKYRISSARLQNWDYGRNAAYFVTICTQGREHYFGDVVDGEMQLSAIGEIAETEWVTTRARKINPNFAWQPRYHDHIIRNNESFERICDYIISNPEKWEEDCNKTD